MKKLVIAIYLTLFLCSGLSANSTDSAYNKLAMGEISGLKYDGYIIGIEKRKREKVKAPEIFDHYKFKLISDKYEDTDQNDCINDEFKDVTNDEKLMLVTHIFEYSHGSLKGKGIYNPYIVKDKVTDKPKLYYQKGYDALDALKIGLSQKIKSSVDMKKPYTHIIVISMGWHNDQKESIRRYNLIMSNIEKYQKNKNYFNPLVLGITWPSAWFSESTSTFVGIAGHISSYFNKSDDADEIGYTIMNYVLYKLVLPIKDDYEKEGVPLKTVAIGHSMGARLLSRAVFSKDFLIDSNTSSEIDLFIGLQAAFSANRFINGEGFECSPYSEFNQKKTVFVLTNSKFDVANPLAFWSEHLGGIDAINTVKNNKEVFFYSKWMKKSTGAYSFDPALNNSAENKIIVADTTSINKGSTDAHNDILDEKMGEFIWNQIERFTIK